MSTRSTLHQPPPTPSSTEARLQSMQASVRPLQGRLAEHPLYSSLRTLEDLHLLLHAQVFAVWDSMSLLKALQRGLTCVDVPWLPSRNPEACRFINSLVLAHESDLFQGEATSHFELYVRAMQQCGATTDAIEDVLFQLGQGEGIQDILSRVPVPEPARTFVRSTFRFVETGKPHVIAAALIYGREDFVPGTFQTFLCDQDAALSGRLSTLRWYTDRSSEMAADEHGPNAQRLLAALCASDDRKWKEAEAVATEALEARLMLLDGMVAEIEAKRAR